MPRNRKNELYTYYNERHYDSESINCCQLDVHKALIRERKASRYESKRVDLFSKRSCTDIICLFFFLAALIAWIVIGVIVFQSGGPGKVFAPVDSQNRRCGYDAGVEKKPNVLFFDITKCLPPNKNLFSCNTKQVCVAECPKNNFSFSYYMERNIPIRNLREKLICGDDFRKYDEIRNYEDARKAISNGVCAGWYMDSTSIFRRCIPLKYLIENLSKNFGNRSDVGEFYETDVQIVIDSLLSLFLSYVTRDVDTHELPDGANVELKGVSSRLVRSGSYAVQNGNGFFHKLIEDLLDKWQYIVMFSCIGMALSFIFIIVMRWITGIIVWSSLFTLICLLGVSSFYCWKKYEEMKSQEEEFQKGSFMNLAGIGGELKLLRSDLLKHEYTWLALFITSVSSLVIILVILLFLRKRLRLAIRLIKEGSKAVAHAWSSLVFPLFPWILQMLIFAHGVFIFCYLIGNTSPIFRVTGLNGSDCFCNKDYKDGDICNVDEFKMACRGRFGQACTAASCEYSETKTENLTIYLHLFNLLMVLWCEYFVSGFSQMSLAMTFGTYYWTAAKAKLPFCIVGRSVFRVLQYHLGTVALGSFLLALLNWVKILVELFYRYISKSDKGIIRCIRCCCGCFLACLHKILRILTKNAYIMCAIRGTSYCASASHAFNLIIKNIIRASVLDGVTSFVFFLMTLLVSITMGVMSFFFFSKPVPTAAGQGTEIEFNYYFFPILLVCLVTFFVSSLFFSVYSAAVDTIFLCALEDLEVNDGSPEKPYVMSKSLMKVFERKNRKPA